MGDQRQGVGIGGQGGVELAAREQAERNLRLDGGGMGALRPFDGNIEGLGAGLGGERRVGVAFEVLEGGVGQQQVAHLDVQAVASRGERVFRRHNDGNGVVGLLVTGQAVGVDGGQVGRQHRVEALGGRGFGGQGPEFVESRPGA